ncbi:MAG TPA: DUF4112 domain-containing protein [Gemmatimonadales bacterium]
MNRSSSTSPISVEVEALPAKRVGRLRRLSYVLDNSIPIPGTPFRIGLDSIIGLVPGIGDLVGGAFSLYIILEAARLGASRTLLARMGWNVALDVLVGAVPVLGDLFDAGWKANMRNLDLLERQVHRPVESARANRRFVMFVGVVLFLLLAGAAALTVLLIKLLMSHPVL